MIAASSLIIMIVDRYEYLQLYRLSDAVQVEKKKLKNYNNNRRSTTAVQQ